LYSREANVVEDIADKWSKWSVSCSFESSHAFTEVGQAKVKVKFKAIAKVKVLFR
jgi:hypothetical protein